MSETDGGSSRRNKSTPFRIEESSIAILNSLIDSSPDAIWLRKTIDECRRDGTPIIVTDARGLEIGRVIKQEDGRYGWGRTT